MSQKKSPSHDRTAAGVSRRRFLATAASAIAIPYYVPASALGREGNVAPSERITLATIGQGGMGRGNTRGFMNNKDCQVVAVCDVDKKHLAEGLSAVHKHYKSQDAKGYSDYRELIARDDIDAVCIATPDHWHGLCTVAAAKAKKHIYCQKPMAHTFAEGQAMVKAVKDAGVIFQTGSQQRSQWNFRQAAEIVLNGHIGKVKHVEIGLPTGHKTAQGQTAETAVPDNIDYEFWVGPSPMIPYVEARLHWNWRWHLSFGGGQLMDWIGHHNDIAHWGLDMDRSGPVEVQAVGFVYPEDRRVWNSAWNYDVRCKYASGTTSSISNGNKMGCKWIGEDGWVYVTRGGFEASNDAWTKRGFDVGARKAYNSPEHHRNFLDGIRDSKECICPAETGHRSITPGHLGLVSEALGGRKLQWDAAKEIIVGDAEADALLKKVDFRKPWSLA